MQTSTGRCKQCENILDTCMPSECMILRDDLMNLSARSGNKEVNA